MCDKELLVGYLYDELQGQERGAFEKHLQSCGECRDEVRALRGARMHLTSWAPAEPDLRFQIVRGGPPLPRRRLSPAWGLAAAAALVLATATAIATVEVRVGSDGVAIRTGWANEAATARADEPGDDRVAPASREDVVAIQQRVRQLETALAAVPPAGLVSAASSNVPAAGERPGEAELLRRVRQWIAESELRQQQELAARLVQSTREIQAAHSLDLVRLERALNQHQGVWNDEVFRQREEMKTMYRMVNAQQR